MRITTSDGYYDHCGEGDDREYCKTHRLLWRSCETVKTGTDDTYTNGKPHLVYNKGDCPECEKEAERRQREEWFKIMERRETHRKEHQHGWFILKGCKKCEEENNVPA